jgi:hypothetical protein
VLCDLERASEVEVQILEPRVGESEGVVRGVPCATVKVGEEEVWSGAGERGGRAERVSAAAERGGEWGTGGEAWPQRSGASGTGGTLRDRFHPLTGSLLGVDQGPIGSFRMGHKLIIFRLVFVRESMRFSSAAVSLSRRDEFHLPEVGVSKVVEHGSFGGDMPRLADHGVTLVRRGPWEV